MAVNIVTGMTGEPHITSDDDRIRNAALFGTGKYIFDVGNKLGASVIDDNTVRIASGMAINQGTQMGIERGNYEDVAIENGTLGMKRTDLIVLRYRKNISTDIEEATIEAIKGTPAASDPQTPTYTSGDILTGVALEDDMPLYEVNIDGVSITGVTLVAELYELGQSGEDVLNKMDKVNPTGTGAFTMNGRKTGSNVGNYSATIGLNNEASNYYAIALGHENSAVSAASVAMGKNNRTGRNYQAVVGSYNITNNNAMFIVGNGTADNLRSNAFEVTADGDAIANRGIKANFISVGRKANTDETAGSAAIGYNNEASEYYSIAMGQNNTALEVAAVALGANNEAAYPASVAIGKGTKTGKANQVAAGQYNRLSADAVFVVGKGTADNARSNAVEVLGTGETRIAGSMTVGSREYNSTVGGGSMASGQSSVASGTNSAAFGTGLIASGHSQVAVGHYNESAANAIFMVGNGNDELGGRSTAFKVTEAGEIYDGNGNISAAIQQLRADINYIAMALGITLGGGN